VLDDGEGLPEHTLINKGKMYFSAKFTNAMRLIAQRTMSAVPVMLVTRSTPNLQVQIRKFS
jgi:hypothetical protein